MGHYIPYHRAKNFAKNRCHRATIVAIDIDHDKILEHMRDSNGGWTYENRRDEITVYSTDRQALTYISIFRC